MMEDDEYPSDSDQSDDDYNPDGNNSDVPSEVDSDGDAESGDDEVVKSKAAKAGKRKRKVQPSSAKRKSQRIDESDVQPEETKSDKDDDAEKRHADALWADFLSDTGESKPDPPKPVTKERENIVDLQKPIRKENNQNITATAKKEETFVPEKKTITEIFEFAGEKVEVEKVVDVNNGSSANKNDDGAVRRPGRGSSRSSGSGIGSILDQLGKPNKITTLEKTKLDWNKFKQREGIEEDLQTFNKGKDGYLERQDFLERTDFRQFEIEKGQRQTTRKK